ncbi:MAG: hypothetical protein H0T46_09440 [Deltaproteobacteria bacterium]|nr:hypothetical protein [Deltaproteobacteria bacterium]
MRSIALALALVIGTTAAWADERITDDTPYKTPEGYVRAGLWKLQYGVHRVPKLEIGTYLLPYASWAFSVRTVNAQAKYQFFDHDRWTLAATLGVAYVDLSKLDVDAQMLIVPLQFVAARRLGDRLSVGFGMMFSSISGDGGYNEDETTVFRGAVAVSNAQSWLSLMMRVSRGWTLYLEARAISSTEAAAEGDVMHQIDDRTRVDVNLTGNASIDEMQGASGLLSFQWSRQRFRMRVGIGYGNYNLPLLNFVIPKATPFPELDLFWVF